MRAFVVTSLYHDAPSQLVGTAGWTQPVIDQVHNVHNVTVEQREYDDGDRTWAAACRCGYSAAESTTFGRALTPMRAHLRAAFRRAERVGGGA